METLNSDLLKTILSFVGNAADFGRLEKTNKYFHRVFQDDNVWALCKELLPRDRAAPNPNKDIALHKIALRGVRKWQKKSDSILESVIGMSGWKVLVNNILASILKVDFNVPGKKSFGLSTTSVELRWDASLYLLEIVEATMIAQLDRAFLLAVHRHEHATTRTDDHNNGGYGFDVPVVTASDWLLQDKLHNQDGTKVGPTKAIGRNATDASHQLDVLIRCGVTKSAYRIVPSRFAYRAGVIKMDREVYAMIWGSILAVTTNLLRPACLTLISELMPREFKPMSRSLNSFYLNRATELKPLPKQTIRLDQNEKIQDINPLPRLSDRCCPICRTVALIFTIVPKQIEEAAKLMKLHPSPKVYGPDGRLADENAESHYRVIFDSNEEGDNSERQAVDSGGSKECGLEEPAAKKRKIMEQPETPQPGKKKVGQEADLASWIESSEEEDWYDEEIEGDEAGFLNNLNESNDEAAEGDTVPPTFLEAALAWDKNVHKSCKHDYDFFPFSLVPDIPKELIPSPEKQDEHE